MAANYTEWFLQLVDTRTKKPIDDDTGLANVLVASDASEETIYSNDKGTSGSNPLTITNGIIRFFTASSVTSVDITILTANGRAFFLEGVTASMHRVDVNTEKENYTLILPYSMNTGCDAVADTGFDLIAGMKVRDVFVHSTTGSTANGINIGVSGTTAGFLALVTTTSTGWKLHGSPIYTNATGSANYISATQIRGSLLSEWSYGLLTASVAGAKGYWSRKSYLVTAATSVIYMVVATNSGGIGEGYIYIEYELCPTAGN